MSTCLHHLYIFYIGMLMALTLHQHDLHYINVISYVNVIMLQYVNMIYIFTSTEFKSHNVMSL